eukprot:745886-Hanusia_phi.AAC.10
MRVKHSLIICCCLSTGCSTRKAVIRHQQVALTYQMLIEFGETGLAMVVDHQDSLDHGELVKLTSRWYVQQGDGDLVRVLTGSTRYNLRSTQQQNKDSVSVKHTQQKTIVYLGQ